MKKEILSQKVFEDIKKDFDDQTAEDMLTAGDRDDYLLKPVT